MNNRELKNLIEDFIEKEGMTLGKFTHKAKINRPYLSSFLNAEEEREVTPKMYDRIAKKYPGLLPKGGEANKQNKQQSGVDSIHIRGNEIYLSESKPLTVHELIAEKEARIQAAEKRAEELKADKMKLDQDKQVLQDLINQNINLIREVLAPIGTTATAVLNYQKAWVDFFSEVHAGDDTKKRDRLIERMNNIVDGKASGDVLMDKGQGAGKLSKQKKP